MNLPKVVPNPGSETISLAHTFGECLADAMRKYPDFYFFSPDETSSNRLDAIYTVSPRVWQQDLKPWDENMAPSGRVIELLSEEALFAVMAGHVMSGGRAAFASYEAFFMLIASQLDQQLKFLADSKKIKWRARQHAFNLLSTSAWERQDHNGFSHQSPALISHLLSKPSNLANCLFPIDDVSAFAAWEFMQQTKDVVNLASFNKNDTVRWIDINHARFQLTNGGASIFQFASDADPELVVSAIGDIATRETLAAIKLAKQEVPSLRIRFVGIAALSYAAIGTTNNKLKQGDFNDYFTLDKPIIVNFHGYPETIRAIFSHYGDPARMLFHGFMEEGSTTTPLDELARNGVSRYDLAASILERAGHYGFQTKFQDLIIRNAEHAKLFGVDG